MTPEQEAVKAAWEKGEYDWSDIWRRNEVIHILRSVIHHMRVTGGFAHRPTDFDDVMRELLRKTALEDPRSWKPENKLLGYGELQDLAGNP
jgi:hypothetical protein